MFAICMDSLITRFTILVCVAWRPMTSSVFGRFLTSQAVPASPVQQSGFCNANLWCLLLVKFKPQGHYSGQKDLPVPLQTSSSRFSLPHRQTLAESAAQALTAQLDSGRWVDYLPGERELSEEFQISRPTLRQALKVLERNGRIEVGQGRRRRILRSGRIRVVGARQNFIGLLSPLPLKSLPPFVLFWVDEVRSALAKVDFRLEFHTSRNISTRQPLKTLERLVYGAPASAWILLLCELAVQKWFAEKKIPCVVAGSSTREFPLPSVDIDYRAACHHAIGVFHRRGHHRLALVVPSTNLIGDIESEAGFSAAGGENPTPIVLRHNGTPDEIARKLEMALNLASPPTGFLVARSAHALTVLTSLLRRNLRFPNQVAVISRDDDGFLDFVTPRLARYRADPKVFARHLSHIVLQMARSGPTSVRPVRLMPNFEAGDTV
jgi:DNA-binding LacI/PurR family transcriptional regulator